MMTNYLLYEEVSEHTW